MRTKESCQSEINIYQIFMRADGLGGDKLKRTRMKTRGRGRARKQMRKCVVLLKWLEQNAISIHKKSIFLIKWAHFEYYYVTDSNANRHNQLNKMYVRDAAKLILNRIFDPNYRHHSFVWSDLFQIQAELRRCKNSAETLSFGLILSLSYSCPYSWERIHIKMI